MGRHSSSLGYQMTCAISSCMAEGESKRAYMRAHHGETGHKVFSYDYKNALCETAKELASYIHTQHPDVKLVRDITPDMVQSYLEYKAETVGSSATLEKVYSHVRKLDKIRCHVYKGSTSYSDTIRMPDMQATAKIKALAMDEETYQKLKLEMQSSPCVKSLILSHAVGLRVEETRCVTYERFSLTGGRFGYGQVTLIGKEDGTKGGRRRVSDIPDAARRDEIKGILSGLQPGQLIVSRRDGSQYARGSITKAIGRSMRRLDLSDEWKYNSSHALRKGYAQACYDGCRRQGDSRAEALSYVDKQLGHGDKRHDIDQAYVLDQW